MKPSFRRSDAKSSKKTRRFDYKDPLSLYQFLEGGKIVPARVSGLSCREQKNLSKACKTARSLGLIPSSIQNFDDFGRPPAISPKKI